MIRVLALLSILALAACAGRGEFTPAPETTSHAQTVFLVTNRIAEPPWRFGTQSAADVSHVRYEVALPSGRDAGELDFTPSRPGAFGIAKAKKLASRKALLEEIARAGPPGAPIGVFVHGFNHNVPEAVYRQAQMSADFGQPGPQVTFGWPSLAVPIGYVADRDAALASRDALEDLLTDLARRQDRPIVLIAHSMGAQLVMETLRQMAIGGRGINDRIEAVILISPDVDIELFSSQVSRIGPLPRPFVVIASQNDRALRLSSRLAGRTPRLGSPADFSVLQAFGITVVDVSEFGDGDAAGHFSAATSPAAIAFLRGMAANDRLFEE